MKDLVKWSQDNWDRVPQLVRDDCLAELKAHVSEDMLKAWCEEYKAGKEIGSTDDFFHFGTGMQVRNVLRKQLSDGELPPVVGPDGGYPAGTPVRNWDDFYQGALVELVEKAIRDGH